MSYKVYDNLGGPDDVLAKMRDFCVEKGWTILENLTPDLPIVEEVVTIPSSYTQPVAATTNKSSLACPIAGKYTGTTTNTYDIQISTSNPVPGVYYDTKYRVRKNGGEWSDEILYTNTGGQDIVADGIYLAFGFKFGDVAEVGDTWTFTAKPTTTSGAGVPDGKRLVIKNGDIIAHFRSANGKQIFKTQINTTPSLAFGIGLTCSTSYSSTPISGYWFDQANATKHASTQEVIGVGIPVKQSSNYKLWCNYIDDPADLLVFSLELEPGYFQHLAVSATQKVGAWTGGTVYSGSRNSVRMFPTSWAMNAIEAESNHLFGMSKYASTFLRCDIDAAPIRKPSVLWASAGQDTSDITTCHTGKILALGVTNIDCITQPWFPKVPHYGYLQSQTSADIGRNVNTLNCISVNLPMAMYVQRDPNALRNFSQVGYVPGIYSISMRNVTPGQLYEISYPRSGNLHQVFPHVHRKGVFGYDGISIKQ